MDRNARRFFFDIDEDGNVILSAPKRTEFDSRGDFRTQGGNSKVEPPPHGGADAMRAMSKLSTGWSGCIEFEGRLFFINVKSVPVERIEGA